MGNYNDAEIINIGTGSDITIRQLAELMAEVTGFRGKIEFDVSKPDGTPIKLLDVLKINNLGWRAGTGLRSGIETTYNWFKERYCFMEG
ncbi:GDP-L-fucose synthase [bioreactor metagenome]|uniref:GDP-L-fucose synthase n=1 Tax=bioreactor metagenome TaxID=1076179 RepID=A0A645G9S9_9ZZZZ